MDSRQSQRRGNLGLHAAISRLALGVFLGGQGQCNYDRNEDGVPGTAASKEELRNVHRYASTDANHCGCVHTDSDLVSALPDRLCRKGLLQLGASVRRTS